VKIAGGKRHMTRPGVIALIVMAALSTGCDVQREAETAAAEEKKIHAVVPRDDIVPGTRIGSSNMAIRGFHEADLPNGYVPPSGFRSVENKAINRPVTGGAPLTYDAVSDFAMQAEIEWLEAEIEQRRDAIEQLEGCTEPCVAKFDEIVERLRK
jgi:hypothetical protein